jgi:hypothetical protein|uniref:Uncharacterized protein n=1 Tax=Sphingobacterium sp. (strain 21) TaxID=743722 RepID=F4C5Y6_SPHS2
MIIHLLHKQYEKKSVDVAFFVAMKINQGVATFYYCPKKGSPLFTSLYKLLSPFLIFP